MAYKLVAFGFAGPLVTFSNSAPNSWDFVRSLHGIPNFWKDYIDGRATRMGAKQMEFKAWKEKKITRDILISDFRKHTKIMNGAPETFSQLKNSGMATAVISDSPSVFVEEIAFALKPKYKAYMKMFFDMNGFAYETEPTHKTTDLRVSKMMALKEFAAAEKASLKECVVVSSNPDADIMRVAGLSVAFNTTDPNLKKVANIHLRTSDLTELLEYLK